MAENSDRELYSEKILKGIVHVDLSKKFWERGATGVAAINSDKKFHRGLALSSSLKKSVLDHSRYTDARLYAICISRIIKEDAKSISSLVICNDANFESVICYLKHLIGERCPELCSLFKLRKQMGKDIKSLAHGIANSYRKRGLKPWRGGNELNSVKITYKEILDDLDTLYQLDKEKM